MCTSFASKISKPAPTHWRLIVDMCYFTFTILHNLVGSNLVQSYYQITSLVSLQLHFICYVGSKLLIHKLPSIFDGSAKLKAQPQDDSKATLAPKVHIAVN